MKFIKFFLLSFIALNFSCVALQSDIAILNEHISNLNKARYQTDLNIKALERKIDELTLKSAATDSNPTMYASVVADLDSIKEDIRLFNGKLEETNYLIDQKTKILEINNQQNTNELARLDKNITTNSDKIMQLSAYVGMEKEIALSSEQVALASSTQISSSSILSEKELYDIAKGLFDQGNLENSRMKFEEFLTQYPQSNMANSAQFWIGEIYYRSESYQKAILEFQKVIENYPTGNKMPTALLRQAFAFEKLAELESAKIVLKDLITKFPNTSEAKIAERKLKTLNPTP